MTKALTMPDFDPGSVWLVGAGPGDPGLLTLHALTGLERADVVLHDALVTEAILGLINPKARLEAVGKRAGKPSAKQLRISQRLVELAAVGHRVVRLKNGDPLVFGRGSEEALALSAANIPFRIVPGITSGIAAPAYAGIPATQRGLSQSVAFVTGHHAGGGASRSVDWAALAKGAETLVLYMSLRQIRTITAELIAAGRPIDDPVAFLADGTTGDQQATVTKLGQAPRVAGSLDQDRPTLIVIGKVVDLRQALSPLQQSGPAMVTEQTEINGQALQATRGLL